MSGKEGKSEGRKKFHFLITQEDDEPEELCKLFLQDEDGNPQKPEMVLRTFLALLARLGATVSEHKKGILIQFLKEEDDG